MRCSIEGRRGGVGGNTLTTVLVALIVLAAAIGAFLYQQRSAPPKGGKLVNWSKAVKRDYVWKVVPAKGGAQSDLPWNNVVFLMVTKSGVATKHHTRNLGGTSSVEVRGAHEGESWHLRSE